MTAAYHEVVALALSSVMLRQGSLLYLLTVWVLGSIIAEVMYKVDYTPLANEKQVLKLSLCALFVSCLCGHVRWCIVFSLLCLWHHYAPIDKNTTSIVDLQTLTPRTQLLLRVNDYLSQQK